VICSNQEERCQEQIDRGIAAREAYSLTLVYVLAESLDRFSRDQEDNAWNPARSNVAPLPPIAERSNSSSSRASFM
jgi:hypothetical protein